MTDNQTDAGRYPFGVLKFTAGKKAADQADALKGRQERFAGRAKTAGTLLTVAVVGTLAVLTVTSPDVVWAMALGACLSILFRRR